MGKAAIIIDGKGSQLDGESRRTIIAFWVFGALVYAAYSLVLAGAQDILAGTFVQTSTVLISTSTPSLLLSLIAPYFMQGIPYSVRVSAVGVTYMLGSLMVAMAQQIHWKITGLGLISIGYGIGETTFSALTSFYHEVTITAYSAGSGVGFAIGPLYYIAMTTWACISPQMTIGMSTPLYVWYCVCFFVMEKKNLSPRPPETDEHYGVEYTALETKEDGGNNSENDENGPQLSGREKFQVIWHMLPHMLPAFIGWFSDYLIIEASVTTLAFPNAPLEPRDHYQYYMFALVMGKVVGRSYLAVLSFIKAEWVEKAKFPYLWLFATIQAALLIFLTLAAWYRFLTSMWLVVLLLFASGVGIGVFYANALAFFRDKFDERYREFAMGYVLFALDAGLFAAGIMGLSTEPLLLEHCETIVINTELCFTRSRSIDRFNSFCYRS